MANTKEILMVDEEIIKEGIKLLIEDFGRLHNLQIVNGLKTLLDCELTADQFLRAVTSLNDMGFLSSHIHNYWKQNKKFVGYNVSNARIDKVDLLKKRYKQIQKEIKERLEKL